MKMQYKPRVATAAASVSMMALAVVSVQSVSAVTAGANGAAHAESAQTQAQQAQSQAQQAQAKAELRLSAAKLKVCQARQTAIQNIMARLADRGQKQLDLFTGIADKTETFYTTKGKTLGDYSTLVSDVNNAKAAAETTVGTIKTDSTGFDCTSNDPKGFVATFKSSLAAEIQALQTYKTAVKNLIVGVKSVQGTTSSSSATNTGDSTNTSKTTTSTTGGQQ